MKHWINRIWLQLEVDGDERGSTVRQTAIFDPHGLAGLAYWYALYPVHHFIFEGMLRRIERAAIASGSQSPARRRGPTPRRGLRTISCNRAEPARSASSMKLANVGSLSSSQ